MSFFLQAWPGDDLLVQYGVWRDSITPVIQLEPPPPESAEALGTFVLSVMPPGPEQSVCFPRDVVFVFDRSGSMTGEGGGLLACGVGAGCVLVVAGGGVRFGSLEKAAGAGQLQPALPEPAEVLFYLFPECDAARAWGQRVLSMHVVLVFDRSGSMTGEGGVCFLSMTGEGGVCFLSVVCRFVMLHTDVFCQQRVQHWNWTCTVAGMLTPSCAVLRCAFCCAGEPMRYAKAALLTGLLKLDPTDRFSLVAFDHDQNWWFGESTSRACFSGLLGACA
jgi:hypothetical protein